MMRVERTDFATVITQDKERALRFYGETLGLRRNDKAHPDWPEFETGNLTLSIVHYEQIGRSEFTPNTAPIALRVGDVHEARRSSRRPASSSSARPTTPRSAISQSSPIPDGNRLMLHRRYAPYADGSTP